MDKRDEQAVDALKLYYQQDLSQVDIAARMGLSRPTVAKLLAHGRDRGFVTITIHDPREEASELAARLVCHACASRTGTQRPRRKLSMRLGAWARTW